MDVLRKELDEIYSRQDPGDEVLNWDEVVRCSERVKALVGIDGSLCVITDIHADRCHFFSGLFLPLLGLTLPSSVDSSDEDEIYNRIHPEDLVEKRMLEYEFFKLIDREDNDCKMDYKAVCRIRMRDRNGNYIYVNNSTQVFHLLRNGSMWLILCRYGLSPDQSIRQGIDPCIVNCRSGDVAALSLIEGRGKILTKREKEILRLIRGGCLSKEIAAILGISLNTVSRHRQNILEKLSVGTSMEAVNAAIQMGLL